MIVNPVPSVCGRSPPHWSSHLLAFRLSVPLLFLARRPCWCPNRVISARAVVVVANIIALGFQSALPTIIARASPPSSMPSVSPDAQVSSFPLAHSCPGTCHWHWLIGQHLVFRLAAGGRQVRFLDLRSPDLRRPGRRISRGFW